VACALTAALVVSPACSDAPDTPEARVRAVLAALEEGARARDAAGMKQHVSETYGDPYGHDKQGVAGLVTLHFLQNRSVHLLTRVAGIELADSEGAARAEVYVAMAGVPIADASALPGVRADLYRFDLALREEPDGDWRVTSAEWRPAQIEDF
jgi:hypothetical protein